MKERVVRYCNNCGVILFLIPWEAKRGKTSYCSRSCQYEWMRENEIGKKPRATLVCDNCGNQYQVQWFRAAKSRFCSKECSLVCARSVRDAKPRKQPVIQICEYCNREYAVCEKYLIGRQRFCSNQCLGLSRRSPDLPADIQFRNSHAYHIWRTDVYKRDDYICQDCGQRGGNLNAHHIFRFNDFGEHRLEIWNGVTLCVLCHAKYHPQQANGLLAVANSKERDAS